MQVIGHQDVFADKHAAHQARLAELSENFMDSGVGENGFSVFRAGGDKVKRMADEKPVKTLEPL
jgi:hypothetical protein